MTFINIGEGMFANRPEALFQEGKELCSLFFFSGEIVRCWTKQIPLESPQSSFKTVSLVRKDHGSVVVYLLCMQEVPGSILSISR